VTVIAPRRFEITNITAEIAGEQAFSLDAHITTRGPVPSDVVTVALGGLLVYCHDAASVRAFARAWADVLQVATGHPALPHLAEFAAGPGWDRHHTGIVLRVAGEPRTKPSTNVIASGASPTGVPHARVSIDRLTVHAYDLTSIQAWADGWATAENAADRIWPTPDAFDEADNRERARIARSGRPTRTGGGAPRR
jgi:hypothetical protein